MQELDVEKAAGIRGDRACPRCKVPLVIVEAQGTQIDVCEKCGGIWFDPRELDRFMSEESPIELLINIKDAIDNEKLPCPACRCFMETKEIYGVTVDECATCNGIWLDAGEMEKIWREEEHIEKPYILDEDEPTPDEKYWNMFREKFQTLKK